MSEHIRLIAFLMMLVLFGCTQSQNSTPAVFAREQRPNSGTWRWRWWRRQWQHVARVCTKNGRSLWTPYPVHPDWAFGLTAPYIAFVQRFW